MAWKRLIAAWRWLALAAVLAVQASEARGEVRYTVTDLGTFGGTYSEALSINNCGQIVGRSTAITGYSIPSHGFLYSNGQMTDLGCLAGSYPTVATAINDAGQIVGHTGYGYSQAFLSSGGPMTCLYASVVSRKSLDL